MKNNGPAIDSLMQSLVNPWQLCVKAKHGAKDAANPFFEMTSMSSRNVTLPVTQPAHTM